MGKKKGSKKKGSGKKTKKAAGSGSSLTQAGPTQIELSLRLELQRLENDVQAAKWEVEDARNQNEFLHDEIRRTTEENNEYEKYISKKTTEEQAHVANLVDKNQHEIDAIETERRLIEHEHARVVKNLKDAIFARESEIERTRRQIEELREVEDKRDEQEKEIEALESAIRDLKSKHFDALQGQKEKFLEEKLSLQKEASAAVAGLQSRAPIEAMACLEKHSVKVKAGNRQLRSKLLSTMAANKELQKYEEALKRENEHLHRQLELDADMARLSVSRERPLK
eukprot:m.956744 g.956744  ORF g.956744 m.956744 type:complete len:282 (-) comp23875_c1_seq1:2651-3496(-)